MTCLALLLMSGCASVMHLSSSSFLSNFSLEELVKKNRSPSGMICARGGLGGGGNSISSVGRAKSSNNKSSSFSCQVSDRAFDEIALLGSLKADVEQAITRSGAKIVNRGSSDPTAFYFEYSERDVLGRITIEGKKSGANYYSLVAKLEETNGTQSKPTPSEPTAA